MRALVPLALLLCMAGGWPVTTAPDAVELTAYDVVVMGEVHDNPAHHANQAAWVARLSPKALVFEMLTPELADAVAKARATGGDLAGAAQWEARGWPDFTIYAPIFDAAPNAAVFGGDVARDQLRTALRDGAAAALGDASALFGLDAPLPRLEAETRQSLQNDAHCGALPTDALPGMVEAQRLRDAALARAVVAAVATVGTPVAVITGNGHARTDWGMPAALHTAMPDLTILSIGQLEQVPTHAQPHDVLTVAAPPERGDPCDVFR